MTERNDYKCTKKDIIIISILIILVLVQIVYNICQNGFSFKF